VQVHGARLHLQLPGRPPAELLAFLDQALAVARAGVATNEPGWSEQAVSKVVRTICDASQATITVQVRLVNTKLRPKCS